MSSRLDLCTLFPLAAGLFMSESVAVIAVFWWLPAPSWRAICLLIIKVVLFCFPPGSVSPFLFAYMALPGRALWSPWPFREILTILLLFTCLGRMLLSARRCVQCFTCGIFQLHSLLRALGHLEKEKLSGCACVRAVAAAQEKGLQWRCWVWLSRSEYTQGWFVLPVPALGRRPWRLPGVLKPAWL